MYYGILSFSVTLFGFQFLLNQRYQKASGSGVTSTLLFSLVNGVVGAICLMLFNGPHLAYTPFTLLLALCASALGFLYTFCSLKAFERVNLSLYSIFAMLGGMMLPFLAGILFWQEPLTLGKTLCVLLIVAALLLTLKKETGKSGLLFCFAVFFLNGMSGVLSKIYQIAPYPKASPAAYSVWSALLSALIAGIALLLIRQKLRRPSVSALLYASGCGALNKIGNYLLLLALAVLPASVQYPFVTGGVMIVTTALAFLSPQKPSRRELLSLALSFIGILVLVLIP